MSCGKRRYGDKLAAMMALAEIQRKDRPQANEVREYRCPKCYGWHLTSQSERYNRETPTPRRPA